MSKYLPFILLFTFYLQFNSILSEFPTDLTCSGVAKRHSIVLNDCKFVNKTDIACTLYSVARQNLQFLPVAGVVKFTTTFYIKNDYEFMDSEGSVDNTWWCLGIRSSLLVTVDELPTDAVDVFDLPDDLSGLIVTMKDALLYAQFYGDAAAGFLKLDDKCGNHNEQLLNSSCITKMVGSSFLILPGDYDFSITDILFGKVVNLYFNTMKGRLKKLKLKTENKGESASVWLSYLRNVNLESLDASYNYFDSIQFNGILPRRFTNMTELLFWYMKDCKLSGIDKSNFDATPNLQTLDISLNKFSKPPPGINKLKSLQILDISANKNQKDVTHFNLGGELRHLNQIKELKLSGQPIYNLSRSSIPKSTFLERLDLSYCSLIHIKEDTFSDLISLTLINLEGNHLNFLYPNTFKYLAFNSIINLKLNKFNNGQNLKFKKYIQLLDFSKNIIKNPQNIIKNGSIEKLDLSKNLITNWTSIDLFKSVQFDIKNLNLSNNKLSVINNVMGESLNDLKSVDIGDNPFQCQDCAILEFQNFISNSSTNILLLNKSEPVTCYSSVDKHDIDLMSAVYNATLCEIIPPNFLLIIGLPFGLISTITFATMLLLYIYRFEVTYMKHLLNVRRKNRESKEKDGCLYDVFVSYCGKDRDWVLEVLLPGLENESDRYVLCLHERDFKLGSFIMDNVVTCIDQSRRVILVITNNYITSEWCKWELQMAQHRIFEDCKDFLVLIELEKIDRDNIPLHLRILMTTRTYLEWPNTDGDDLVNISSFWSRLKSALGIAIAHIEIEAHKQREEAREREEEEEYYANLNLTPFQPITI